LIGAVVVFAVEDSFTGAHHLDLAGGDDLFVTHIILVGQAAFERDTDDLHIIMGV
jgi:hypothetical protein